MKWLLSTQPSHLHEQILPHLERRKSSLGSLHIRSNAQCLRSIGLIHQWKTLQNPQAQPMRNQ
jgi:hypothetical protein